VCFTASCETREAGSLTKEPPHQAGTFNLVSLKDGRIGEICYGITPSVSANSDCLSSRRQFLARARVILAPEPRSTTLNDFSSSRSKAVTATRRDPQNALRPLKSSRSPRRLSCVA